LERAGRAPRGGRPRPRDLSRTHHRRHDRRPQQSGGDRRADVGTRGVSRAAARVKLAAPVVIPVGATAAGLVVGAALVAATGPSLVSAVAAFWDGMFGSTFAMGASINRAVALTLVGLGFILANRANLTNVGGEGQLAVGGMAATALALHGAERFPLGL